MSWLNKGLKILAGLLVVLVLGGFLLPSKVHVERKITINAQPQQIYPLISNLSSWNKWSPWAKIDSNAQFKITGRGIGQKMVWASENPNVGYGTQEIIALDKHRQVKTQLDFGSKGRAIAQFNLDPEDSSTNITWSLDTDMRDSVPIYLKPISTYMGFMMDGMIGKNYEQGLDNLRQTVEK